MTKNIKGPRGSISIEKAILADVCLGTPLGSLVFGLSEPLNFSEDVSRLETFLFRGQQLDAVKSHFQSGDPRIVEALTELIDMAESLMLAGPFSVTQKPNLRFGQNAHDYQSLAKYWWPNPGKADAGKYIRQDGKINPECYSDDFDYLRLVEFAETTVSLALTAFLTDDRRYAERAAFLIKAWFIDPETRQNPNFQLAQCVPGNNKVNFSGTIEARQLIYVIEAIQIVKSMGLFSDEDSRVIENWFEALLDWMTLSEQGKKAGLAKNNIGYWYDLQCIIYARFCGRDELAQGIVEKRIVGRLKEGMAEDGSMPMETARANPSDYVAFSLVAMALISRSQPSGMSSLWTTQDADGRNFQAARDWFTRALGVKIDKPNLRQGLELIAARKNILLGEKEIDRLKDQLATLEKELDEVRDRENSFSRECETYKEDMSALEAKQMTLLQSNSWRVTKPLRAVSRRLRSALDLEYKQPMALPGLSNFNRFSTLNRARGLKRRLERYAVPYLPTARIVNKKGQAPGNNARPTLVKAGNSASFRDFRSVRPVNEQAIKEAYEKSALAKEPNTFALYRIIGNDLNPRHKKGQSYDNLRFILENESPLPDCTKFWVVNRIFDPDPERDIIDLLKQHHQEFVHIPFVAEDYRKIGLDYDCFPDRRFLESDEYRALTPKFRGQAQAALYRLKNLYVMNNNGARNIALNDGRRHAKWVLPWDGNCFVTRPAWESLHSAVNARAHLKYFVTPMDRVTDNKAFLDDNYVANPAEEPQLLFRRDSTLEFDQKFPYGRRPKVEIFWRLGMPGPWDHWKDHAWDLPRSRPSSEARNFGVAGWVTRLSSGNTSLDRKDRTTDSERAEVRCAAIVETIRELDRSLVNGRQGRDGTVVNSLLQSDDLDRSTRRTQQSDSIKAQDQKTENKRKTPSGSKQSKTIAGWLQDVDSQIASLPQPPPDGQLEVAFVISMRSKRASRDWESACDCLSKTLRTVFAQSDQNYRLLVAGHEKPDIPELESNKVTWVSVSYTPPSNPRGFTADKNAKRRELGFLLGKKGFEGFVMPLDADDWIHRRLVEFIRRSGEKSPTFFDAGFLCNLEERELRVRTGADGKRPFFKGCGSGSFFYFKHSDFPRSPTIRASKKVKFFYAVSSHVGVLEKLLQDEVRIRRVRMPMVTWVLGHVNNNSSMKGRNTNPSSGESPQAIGTLFLEKFAYQRLHSHFHVVAHRLDGMGERLRILIQAMHVADSLGCEYRFTWQDTHLMTRTSFHTLPAASNMFSSDFLNAHLLETNFDPNDYRILEYKCFLKDHWKEKNWPNGDKGILLQGPRKVSMSDIPQELESRSRYRSYFDKIEFSPDLMKAIQAAQSVPLSNRTIAFHLRGGDIVFGRARERPRYLFKVVPLPLAISFAKELIAEGNTVLVFGDDQDSIRLMESFGAVAAINLTERLSETSTQADLFDMVLMSRCDKIYASDSSAFANLATLIGSAELINVISLEKPQKILKRIDMECVNHLDCSKLHISQAYKLLYYGLGHHLSKKDRDYSLARAMDFDPENLLYRLTTAANLIQDGRIQAAESRLCSLFEDDFERRGIFPLSSMKLLNYFAWTDALLKPERDRFVDNMDKGFAYIDIYAAFVLHNDGLVEQAGKIVDHSPLLEKGHPIAKEFKRKLELDRVTSVRHDDK